MTAASAPIGGLWSIGEVLQQLRAEFPDVTISKLRFLETEGLVEPARTPSGYRKFSHADVERLRYVLAAQRDHYLPLKVIRVHLDAIDRGLEPPPMGSADGPRVPRSLVSTAGLPRAEDFRPSGARVRLSREELCASAGLDDATLTQLEGFGLIVIAPGGHYDGDALTIASTVAELTGYGIEPRHLRQFKVAADREIGLVEQVVAPLTHQRSGTSQVRGAETRRELAALSIRLHAALVKSGLNRDPR